MSLQIIFTKNCIFYYYSNYKFLLSINIFICIHFLKFIYCIFINFIL